MHALLAGRDRTPPLPPLGEAIALTSNDEARDGVVVTLETGPDWTPVCMVASGGVFTSGSAETGAALVFLRYGVRIFVRNGSGDTSTGFATALSLFVMS
ncbi:hypothetical protein BDA96_01G133000 [Sorghum bicolor]|jgi:hypothetical protein|uniref:Uncharacterized protein n=1 Tax=Sorghum bicolor TaxID=4558 RepID=A0A921RZH7_SORBI|nr:hypothetical protein BDA96_01G133000 [Sorghum bicolor]